ncbi:MAG: hypothetical protein BroJett011_41830 [Chloroflexota bacterium]|nr:MAG: hypothetical protein BroJett011_41830 [Chloroflexota bacterium]
MKRYEPMWPEQQLNDEDEPRGYRPGLITVIITLLLILALLATLVWPLLQIRPRYLPTPTPSVLREA